MKRIEWRPVLSILDFPLTVQGLGVYLNAKKEPFLIAPSEEVALEIAGRMNRDASNDAFGRSAPPPVSSQDGEGG